LLDKNIIVIIERKYEMPTISSFYGITIKMYFQQSEHNPPHFHVIYGEFVFHKVIAVKPLENFILEITFENGSVKKYDLIS